MQSYLLLFFYQSVWGCGEGEVLPQTAFRKIDAGRVHAPFSTIKLKCFPDY